MSFVPIEIDAFIDLHVKSNPGEDPADLKSRLTQALADRQAGETCDCGEPIWVIGSAVARYACFTCITGEAVPDDDYEIAGAC
ncbi:MAG: hypothetical protein RL885_15420 [Planctomycetota bacterium]